MISTRVCDALGTGVLGIARLPVQQISASGARADRDLAALFCRAHDARPIHDLPRAGEVVERMVGEAAAILGDRLPALVRSR